MVFVKYSKYTSKSVSQPPDQIYKQMKKNNTSLFNEIDTINNGNEIMLDSLKDQTSRLLGVTKSLDVSLQEDNKELDSLRTKLFRGTDLSSKSRSLLHSITEDPSYFGVFKIAMLVFICLCLLYFGGKLICKLF